MKLSNIFFAVALLAITVESNGMEEEASLHQLATEGKIKELSKVLDKDGNIDAQDAEGKTPLMYAVEKGWFALTSQLVIKYKANLEVEGPDNKTALHYAATSAENNKSIQAGICNLLLNRGANPNARTIHKRTPLHEAVLNNHEHVVVQLLLSKADKELTDYKNNTALDYAENNKNETIIDLLTDTSDESLFSLSTGSCSSVSDSSSRQSFSFPLPPIITEADIKRREEEERNDNSSPTLERLEAARQKLLEIKKDNEKV